MSRDAWLSSGKNRYLTLLSISSLVNPNVSAIARKSEKNMTTKGFFEIRKADFSNNLSRNTITDFAKKLHLDVNLWKHDGEEFSIGLFMFAELRRTIGSGKLTAYTSLE